MQISNETAQARLAKAGGANHRIDTDAERATAREVLRAATGVTDRAKLDKAVASIRSAGGSRDAVRAAIDLLERKPAAKDGARTTGSSPTSDAKVGARAAGFGDIFDTVKKVVSGGAKAVGNVVSKAAGSAASAARTGVREVGRGATATYKVARGAVDAAKKGASTVVKTIGTGASAGVKFLNKHSIEIGVSLAIAATIAGTGGLAAGPLLAIGAGGFAALNSGKAFAKGDPVGGILQGVAILPGAAAATPLLSRATSALAGRTSLGKALASRGLKLVHDNKRNVSVLAFTGNAASDVKARYSEYRRSGVPTNPEALLRDVLLVAGGRRLATGR